MAVEDIVRELLEIGGRKVPDDKIREYSGKLERITRVTGEEVFRKAVEVARNAVNASEPIVDGTLIVHIARDEHIAKAHVERGNSSVGYRITSLILGTIVELVISVGIRGLLRIEFVDFGYRIEIALHKDLSIEFRETGIPPVERSTIEEIKELLDFLNAVVRQVGDKLKERDDHVRRLVNISKRRLDIQRTTVSFYGKSEITVYHKEGYIIIFVYVKSEDEAGEVSRRMAETISYLADNYDWLYGLSRTLVDIMKACVRWKRELYATRKVDGVECRVDLGRDYVKVTVRHDKTSDWLKVTKKTITVKTGDIGRMMQYVENIYDLFQRMKVGCALLELYP